MSRIHQQLSSVQKHRVPAPSDPVPADTQTARLQTRLAELEGELEKARKEAAAAAQAAERVRDLETRLATLSGERDKARAEIKTLKTASERSGRELKAALETLAAEKTGHAGLRRESREREKALQADAAERDRTAAARIRELESQAEQSTRLLEAAQAEIQKARRTAGRQAHAAETAAEHTRELEQRIERLAAENRDLTTRAERQAGEAQRWRAEAAGAVQTAADVEAGLRSTLMETEQNLQNERDRAAELERRFADQARAHEAYRQEARRREAQRAGGPDAPGPAGRTWFLRLDDGSLYGPADLDRLVDWAAQCRIGPEHEVSTDKTRWIKATEVPELGLEWDVTLADGAAYGPVNLFAVRDLIADNSVSAESSIVNRHSGETWPAGRVLSPDIVRVYDENRSLKQDLAQRKRALAETEARVKELEARIAELQSRVAPHASAPPKIVSQRLRREAPA
ncbi:MAG: hypothetical protein JW951_07160 [Lentisphaerae bacterium]|nr:hypothetical protein [Lentisphaerota bacterium]